MKRKSKLLPLLFTLIALTQSLPAYVDPGIVGMLFQAGFAIVFGFLLAMFLKPIHFIRLLFRKLRKKKTPPADECK